MKTDSSWRSWTLGELCDAGHALIQTGPFGSQLHSSDYTPTGTCVIATEGIGRRHIIDNGLPRVPMSVVQRLHRHILHQGDILFARRGAQATGLSALVSREFEGSLCGTGAILLRVARSMIDPIYFSFFLACAETVRWLKFHAVGAVMPNLNEGILRQLSLRLPPISDQRSIASVLSALDDKIELNRRMNETLEEMARALFKSWFVDFDPVRAKMEGRAPAGMDAETAALFPDSFEDSELGPIPKGWAYRPVRTVSEGLYDGPHATPPESDTGAIFLGIPSFTPTSLDLTKVRYISEVDWPRWTKRVVPAHLDIVFTYEATLGYFALIPPGLRCCLGRRTALVRPRSEVRDSHFLFHWFVSPPFQNFLRAHRQPGSTVDRIWLKDFPEYPVLQPGASLVECFEGFAASVWTRIHANHAEIATLSALRDALLPRLLSGELRVKDAERLAEASL